MNPAYAPAAAILNRLPSTVKILLLATMSLIPIAILGWIAIMGAYNAVINTNYLSLQRYHEWWRYDRPHGK